MRINYISNIKYQSDWYYISYRMRSNDFGLLLEKRWGKRDREPRFAFFILCFIKFRIDLLLYQCSARSSCIFDFCSKSCNSYRESSVNRDMSLPRIAEALPLIFLHPELAVWSHSNLDEIVLSLRDKFSM